MTTRVIRQERVKNKPAEGGERRYVVIAPDGHEIFGVRGEIDAAHDRLAEVREKYEGTHDYLIAKVEWEPVYEVVAYEMKYVAIDN